MTTVRDLLKADLARIGITQEQFGERLGVRQQAISQWYKRNAIPLGKQRAVIDALGPQSAIAQAIANGELEGETLPPVLRDAPRAAYEVRRHPHTPPRTPVVRERQSGERHPAARRRDDLLDVILAELPASGCIDVFLEVGPYRKRFDYASPSLVAQVMNPGLITERREIHPHHVARRILDLALVKRQMPERECVLLIVLGDAAEAIGGRGVQQAIWEASQFDVAVYPVRNYAEAGRLIVDFEINAGFAETAEPIADDESYLEDGDEPPNVSDVRG